MKFTLNEKFILNERFILTEATTVTPEENLKDLLTERNSELIIINNEIDKAKEEFKKSETAAKDVQDIKNGLATIEKAITAIKSTEQFNIEITRFLGEFNKTEFAKNAKIKQHLDEITKAQNSSDKNKVIELFNTLKTALDGLKEQASTGDENIDALADAIKTLQEVIGTDEHADEQIKKLIETLTKDDIDLTNIIKVAEVPFIEKGKTTIDLEDKATVEKLTKTIQNLNNLLQSSEARKAGAKQSWEERFQKARPEERQAIWDEWYASWGKYEQTVRSLGEAVQAELEFYSFDKKLNPFLIFIENWIATDKSDKLTLNSNSYGALHNFIGNNQMSAQVLKTGGKAGNECVIFNKNWYTLPHDLMLEIFNFQDKCYSDGSISLPEDLFEADGKSTYGTPAGGNITIEEKHQFFNDLVYKDGDPSVGKKATTTEFLPVAVLRARFKQYSISNAKQSVEDTAKNVGSIFKNLNGPSGQMLIQYIILMAVQPTELKNALARYGFTPDKLANFTTLSNEYVKQLKNISDLAKNWQTLTDGIAKDPNVNITIHGNDTQAQQGQAAAQPTAA